MGIFSRMSNMIKGKVNANLDNMENQNELMDQKIRDMDEAYNKAKLSSAQILGNTHEIEKKLATAKAESADYEEKVKLALSKGNEELAKRALLKKVEADKKIVSLQASYDASKVQGETLKANLRSLEDEIQKTREYRDSASARLATADAQIEVNKILSNTSTKSSDIRIDDIERKIQKKEGLAQGLGDLTQVDNFDSEFAKLDEVDLDLELQKYKTDK